MTLWLSSRLLLSGMSHWVGDMTPAEAGERFLQQHLCNILLCLHFCTVVYTHTHCTPVGSWSLWYDLERLRALAVKAGSPSVSSRGYGCAARLCLWGQDRAAAHQLWRRGLVRFRNTTSQSQHFTGEASHSHTAGGVGVARQKVLRQTATMCCDELSSRYDLVCQGV